MSLRFYNSDGKIVFKVPTVDGKGEKNPTLADAKSLGLYLSVSTVAKVGGDSSSLEHWFKSEPIRIAGRERAWKLLQDNPDAWVGAMLEESEKQMMRAATRGTLIHSMAENYAKWVVNPKASFSPTKDLEPYALVLHNIFQAHKIVPKLIEQPVFDKGSQTSGTCDLLASKAFGKKNVLVDFKTQGFKSGKAKDYFNYKLQVAAYSVASTGKPGWCAIIYLDTSTFGGADNVPATSVTLIPPKETKALYKLYKACAKIKYTSFNWDERARVIK